jgi:hypothetical protein
VAIEINDNSNRDDQRVEQDKQKARKDLERRQQQRPMETFEAKLSEKAAHDVASKQSDATRFRLQKEIKKEKQSIIEKLIKGAKPSTADEKRAPEEGRQARHAKSARRTPFEEETVRKDPLQPAETVDGREEAAFVEDEAAPSETQEEGKEGEVAEDGHKRVAEKGREDSGSGTGGGGGGQESGQMMQDQGGGQGFGSGREGTGGERKQGFTLDRDGAVGGVRGAAGSRGHGAGGFQNSQRAFTPKNIDDIVANVQVGVNEKGEEVFAVTLEDLYFDGLKLQATRTPQGVVLKFVCPNISVRNTFIRERPLIYERLKAKNISVFRIDIV